MAFLILKHLVEAPPPPACLYFSLFSFLHSDSIFPFKEDPHFHPSSEVVLTGDPFIAGR